jgi:hypothetical protein
LSMWYRSKTERVSWPVMVTATPLGSVGIPEPSWRPDDLLPKAPCRGTTIAPRGGRGQAPEPGGDRPRGPSGREQPPPMALGQKEPGPAGAGTKGVGTPQDRVDLGDHERPRAGGEPGSCGMNAAPAVSTPKRTTTRSFERTGRRAVSCSIRLAAAAASATGPPMASRGRARAVRAHPAGSRHRRGQPPIRRRPPPRGHWSTSRANSILRSGSRQPARSPVRQVPRLDFNRAARAPSERKDGLDPTVSGGDEEEGLSFDSCYMSPFDEVRPESESPWLGRGRSLHELRPLMSSLDHVADGVQDQLAGVK